MAENMIPDNPELIGGQNKMWTPDEIKKGLACYADQVTCADIYCTECPNNTSYGGHEEVMADALAYIRELEAKTTAADAVPVVHGKALDWLRKQMLHKLRSLYNAEKRSGVTEKELNNLREHIQLINYIIEKLEE